MFVENSCVLQKFINPISKKYQEMYREEPFLSKISQDFIEKILNEIKHFDDFLKTINIQETNLEKNNLPKGFYYYHIPPEIKRTIEETSWFGKKYTFSLREHMFTIFCVVPTNEISGEKEIHNWLESIKIKIFSWLSLVSSQSSSKNCSKNLNIYFYFTNFEKKIHRENAILGTFNVNSAYTFSCNINENGDNEMYIYRKEEWFKVFIHETFHSFSLDFSNINESLQNNVNKKLKLIFPLHIDFRFYETYTEIWAEIINIIYIAHFSPTKNKISQINEFLQKEQLFSLFQMIKILKHNQISYNELYENTEKAKIKRMHKYKENTPVFSYYILKAVCMMNVDEFIEWNAFTNKGSLNMNKSQEKIDSLIEFINQKYMNTDFLQSIYFMEKYYNNLLKKKKDSFLSNNLRMTMFETK